MADIGQWSGGTTTLLPTTTFAAPNGMFPTQDRNDASYSFNSTTSTLTLPPDADGYLVTAAFEFVDTSNGRHNPQGRLVLSSGSGNFVASSGSGFNRNNSDDTAYVRAWAVIDSPSSAEVQFQWRRDSDAPTGGTSASFLQVVPLYYSNIGLYQSTQTSCNGTTTPTSISGFTSVVQSDTSAIEISSGQTVATKTSGKRYLVLGGQYWQGIGAARTQRWMGLSVNSTFQNDVRSNSYGRNSSNADIGEIFTTVVEGVNSLESQVFLGEALGSFPATGGDVSGNTTGSNANHVLAVIELNDNAEVFRAVSGTQQDVSGTSRTSVEVFDSTSLLDTASFSTNATTTSVTANDDFDVLLGANLSGGYGSSSGSRYTGFSKFTIDGVEQDSSISGDFSRGSQGSQSTFGYSSNMLSSHAVSDTETLGVNIGRITGGQAGPVNLLSGYSGMWGVNLDTLEETATNVEVDTQDLSVSTDISDKSVSSNLSLGVSGLALSSALSSRSVGLAVSLNTSDLSATTSVSSRTLGGSVSVSIEPIPSATGVQGKEIISNATVSTEDASVATSVSSRSVSSNSSVNLSPPSAQTFVSDRTLGGSVSLSLDNISLQTSVASRSFGGSTSVDISPLSSQSVVQSKSVSSSFELFREDIESTTSTLSISLTTDYQVSLESLVSELEFEGKALVLDVTLDREDFGSATQVEPKTISSASVVSTEGLEVSSDVEDRLIILPIPTPPERSFKVPSDIRTGRVTFESRVFKVDLSTRDLTVDSRLRVFLVPQRTRTFKI